LFARLLTLLALFFIQITSFLTGLSIGAPPLRLTERPMTATGDEQDQKDRAKNPRQEAGDHTGMATGGMIG
jgi:hypothetical protein